MVERVTSYNYGGYSYSTCEHFREKIPVDAKHNVYLSSSRGHYKARLQEGAQAVDFGVYLDGTWKYDLRGPTTDVMVSSTLPDKFIPPQELQYTWDGTPDDALPGIYFPWTDHGAPPLYKLKALLAWLNPIIDSGALVEIACIGGHGRTGTLAAALILSRNSGKEFNAQVVMQVLRKIYCKNAIESYTQEKILYELNGETAPPQKAAYTAPAKPTSSTNTTFTKPTTTELLKDIREYYQQAPVTRLGLDWRGFDFRKEVITLPAGNAGESSTPDMFNYYGLD